MEAPRPVVDWTALKRFIQDGAVVQQETATRLTVYQPQLGLSIVVASEWTPDADIYRLPEPLASARWVWAATPRLLKDPERPRQVWGLFFRAPFLNLVRLDRPDPITTDLTTCPPLAVPPPDTAPATIGTNPPGKGSEVVRPLDSSSASPRSVEARSRPEELSTTETSITPSLVSPGLPSEAPGVGPMLGLSTAPQQVRVGARASIISLGSHTRLGGGLEVGDGSGTTSFYVSFEGAYHFGEHEHRWHPYVGLAAGPTVIRTPDGSHTSRLQGRLRAGVSRILTNRRGSVFLELSTGFNGPEMILSAGWALALDAAP